MSSNHGLDEMLLRYHETIDNIARLGVENLTQEGRLAVDRLKEDAFFAMRHCAELIGHAIHQYQKGRWR